MALADDITALPVAPLAGDPGHPQSHTTIDAALKSHESRLLVPTAVKTAAYTALAGQLVQANATTASLTVTLPAATAGLRVGVAKVNADTSVNTVTIAAAGTDTISGTTVLRLPGEVRTFTAVAGSWVMDGGATTLASTDNRYGVTVSMTRFGATGDGTDHTAAFNAAIAFANTLGGNDRANVHGVTFVIADGWYGLPTPLNPITVSGVQFKGQSEQSTVLRVSAAGSLFTFGDATKNRLPVGAGISNLKIEYTTAPAATDSFATIAYCADFRLEDIQCVLVPTLLNLGTSSALYASGVLVDRVKGSVANVGAPVFKMNNGAGLTVSNTGLFVSGVAAPVHPANMTTVANTIVFVGPTTGSWDTLQISNSIFERFDQAIAAVVASGGVFQDVFVSNTVFDYTRRYGMYLESQAGGVITNIRTDKNCWFVSWETDAIVLVGAGFHDSHEIGGTVTIGGVGALNYNLPSAKNVVIELALGAIGQKTAAPGAIYFAPSSTGFTVKNCTGNDDNTASGLPWRSDWGITVGANCDNFLVTGCRLTGTGGGYNTFAANGGGSVKRLMTNNVGTGYAGYGGAFTLAATGVANTNTTPQVWEVSIFGGTVTAIAKNGTTIAGMTAGTLRVSPGETFTVTYSAAPTISQFVLP